MKGISTDVRANDIPKDLRAFLKRPVLIILTIGIIIRVVLMPVLTVGYDVMHWALAMQHIQSGSGLYDIAGYWYTPVWGYILGFMSSIMNMFGVTDYGSLFDEALHLEDLGWISATIPTPAFSFIVKIPSVIADVLVGYLIYRMIVERTGDEKKATYGFALWFLCPIVIFTSSVHGMFDSIYVLFTVLSVYSLLKGHDLLAGVSLSIAVLLKIFPLYIAFALIAYLAMKHKGDPRTFRRRTLTMAIGFAVMTFIVYIPQILDGTVMDSLLFLTTRIDTPAAASERMWDTLIATGMMLITWLQIVFLILAAAVAYKMYKKDPADKEKALFTCLMATTLIIFLWPTESQFLLLPLPFLIFFIVLYDKRFTLPFLLIAIGAVFITVSPSVLLSLAAYTDILDLGSVISLVELTHGRLAFELSVMDIVHATGAAVALAGVVTAVIYWLRMEREGKNDA